MACLGETHEVAIVGNDGDAEEQETARRVAGRIEASPDGYKASLQHMLDDGARHFRIGPNASGARAMTMTDSKIST